MGGEVGSDALEYQLAVPLHRAQALCDPRQTLEHLCACACTPGHARVHRHTPHARVHRHTPRGHTPSPRRRF